MLFGGEFTSTTPKPGWDCGNRETYKMYLNLRSFQNIRQNEWENRKVSFYMKIGGKMRGKKNEISNSAFT